MTSVYEWHCSHACTLVMGRTMGLPSVIEISTNHIYLVFLGFFVIVQWTLPNTILIRDIDMLSTYVPI